MSLAVVTLKKGEGRLLKAGGMWVFDRKNILEPKETTYKRYLVDTLDIKRR